MSTDDSISEDVSSLGALSHGHVSADRDGGKESETSLVSSEGTSASGLAISEDRHTASESTGGTVESRPVDITPACNKIRSLCLSTVEAFEQGKDLPFINPSSLETLRALVQEIQSSRETDPEIGKDCKGRLLHLFQLVEKQYQEQILAQQEQLQCHIQLIQEEIKTLVQLQNRQASVQLHSEFPPAPTTEANSDTKDYIFPLISGDCTVPKNVPSETDGLAAPLAHSPSTPPSPPLCRPETANQGEERAATMLSSGYGTLSTWETGPEPAGTPGEDEDGSRGREKPHWPSHFQEDTETTVIGCQQDFSDERTFGLLKTGTSQPLTSWAHKQKLRPRKSKVGQALPRTPEDQVQPHSPRGPHRPNPLESTDSQEQHRTAGPSSSSLPLRRSDSLVSEASGLTYWRLNESELYRALPDSFYSDAYLLLQEASMSLTPSQEPPLSLREIYQNNQRSDCRRSDWEGSVTSGPSSSQVFTLDPAVNMRHSDCTSGFTSPSHFSSPTFATQPHRYPRVGTPVTPDSLVECSPNPADTDYISDSSSVSVAGLSPSKMQSLWGNSSQALPGVSPSILPQDKPQPCSHTASQQRRASAPLASEEEGSHTHTSTLKPCSASGATLQLAVNPRMDRTLSLEDPVVLSILRQNLREKHSRHVADLKAYYESEIQILKDKLKLREPPQDLEKSNQALAERCKRLEKALAEATSRIQELEATNSLLEKKLAEWPERYAVAGATVKSLQQQLEESRCSGREKDALAARLKTRVRQLEEAAQKACREAEEKEARRESEYQMLQDLRGEYYSLMKKHEDTKDELVAAENKLVGVKDQMSKMNRIISKLESQIRQLVHENQARTRYSSRSKAQPSGAGLFHHPDLLPSPSKCKVDPDVARRKSPGPLSDQLNGGRKSPLPQTNQSSLHRKTLYKSADESSGPGSSVDTSSSGESWRGASPPECEQSLPQTRHREQSQREAGRKEASCTLTPMMRALIELEGTRATESRAPCKNSSTTHRVGSQRTTVGFVEQRHKEPIQERVGLQADREVEKPGGAVDGAERGGGGGGAGAGAAAAAAAAAAEEAGAGRGAKSRSGAEGATARLRAQRSLSPEGHRSSSLPPAHRNVPTTTPTKRKSLLMPLSAKSSPKRCPTENYSTAFGHLMPREEHLPKRCDGQFDQRRHSFHQSGAMKRLQFTSEDREDDLHQPDISGNTNPPDGGSRPGWAEPGAGAGPDPQDSCELSEPLVLDRLHSLADVEKLFDELTQEKLHIEAALSRMPGAGGRVTLQARLDEAALEDRLERLNRELGSIRMTLKRFHVLRSSANV